MVRVELHAELPRSGRRIITTPEIELWEAPENRIMLHNGLGMVELAPFEGLKIIALTMGGRTVTTRAVPYLACEFPPETVTVTENTHLRIDDDEHGAFVALGGTIATCPTEGRALRMGLEFRFYNRSGVIRGKLWVTGRLERDEAPMVRIAQSAHDPETGATAEEIFLRRHHTLDWNVRLYRYPTGDGDIFVYRDAELRETEPAIRLLIPFREPSASPLHFEWYMGALTAPGMIRCQEHLASTRKAATFDPVALDNSSH